MSITNNDEDLSSGSPGTASAQDELDNWFIDRQRHTLKDELRDFKIFNSVRQVLLNARDFLWEHLTESDIVEEVKAIDSDLAQDPNIAKKVSETLKIGCSSHHGLQEFQKYHSYQDWYYLIDIPPEHAHAICSMTTAFIYAFEKSSFKSLTNIDTYGVLVKMPELTKYYCGLLFTLFRRDNIWSEDLYRKYFQFVLSESKTSCSALGIVISYLMQLGFEHEMFHVLLSRCIVHFVNAHQQTGVSLYYSSKVMNPNRKIIPMVTCKNIEISEESYIHDLVGIAVPQVLSQYTKDHPGESGYLHKEDIITGLAELSPLFKSFSISEEIVSETVEQIISGESTFCGISTSSDNKSCLNQEEFSIEQAENLVWMCNRFFNAYIFKSMSKPIDLEIVELLEKCPILTKYYISHVSTIFRYSDQYTEDFYLCYVKTIYWEVECHLDKTELLISHIFTLGKVDPKFLKGLEAYIIPFLKLFQKCGSSIYSNTRDII